MWGNRDEYGCGGEKERKTESEGDEQCKCGPSGKETQNRALRGGNLSDTSSPHRSGKRCVRRHWSPFLEAVVETKHYG